MQAARPGAMTPFGLKLRELRRDHGVSLKAMAEALEVSSAYLSALEHGHRGRPSWWLVQRICGYFHIIWDDAEELQRLAQISHPRVVIDTSGLSPQATELANLLAARISELSEDEIRNLIEKLRTRAPQR
jgi:transcriptional regulator with XRE-family HTH domain